MPNPDRHLLIISDTKITYLTGILLGHNLRLSTDDRTSVAATATIYMPIAISPTSTPTFHDSPLSDTSEETSPSELPSEEPPEPNFPYAITTEELTFPYDIPTE